jgi:hypothetical protein
MHATSSKFIQALTLSAALCLISGAGLAAVEEPIDSRFVLAQPDSLRGDWEGTAGFVAQVFPTGDGTYQANVFHAFDLPDNTPVVILQGTRTGDQIAFAGNGWSGRIAKARFIARKGYEKFNLHHVTRSPPTLGAAPPRGAVVLFDGTNADAWATKDGRNWLTERPGPASAKIVDGALEVIPGTGGGLISHRKFGDAHIHVEFRTLGFPSNSGVFLQTRYEADINETYGKLDGSPNGNFGNCMPASAVTHFRPTRPVLEWNTFDFDFQAPRFDAAGNKTENGHVTLYLNGVMTYDHQDVAPEKGAAGRLGEAPTGPLYLQEHGMPVQFRNIWVVEK